MNTTSKGSTLLSHEVYDRFAQLDQGDVQKAMATYVWIDEYRCEHLRSKYRCLDFVPRHFSELPRWEYAACKDPSQPMNTTYPERCLHPVAMYRDPFLRGNNVIVFCEVLETFNPPDRPKLENHRFSCKAVLDSVKDCDFWFGFEQEYFIMGENGDPLGWPSEGLPLEQGFGLPSHCGVGLNRVFGRYVAESHMRACLYAGLKMYGTTPEAIPAQWEFQTGPCNAIEACDQLWVARFLLHRVAEEFGVEITFDPQPIPGEGLYGTGCHCNFSTKQMREPETGLKVMEDACQKLSKRHQKHLQTYDLNGGEDNKRRLTASAVESFTWGVGTRTTSARIPKRCHENGCGYVEDRRPAGNADPYQVVEMITRTVCLDE